MQTNKQLSIFCQSLNMSKDQIQQYANSKNKQTNKQNITKAKTYYGFERAMHRKTQNIWSSGNINPVNINGACKSAAAEDLTHLCFMIFCLLLLSLHSCLYFQTKITHIPSIKECGLADFYDSDILRPLI